jgi:hypothetical protein
MEGKKLLLESMNHRQKFPRRKHMFTGPPQCLSFIRLRPWWQVVKCLLLISHYVNIILAIVRLRMYVYRKHTSRKLGALREGIRMKNSACKGVIVVYSSLYSEGQDSRSSIPGMGKIFPLLRASRPTLGPTQPPIGGIIPGCKAAGAWSWPLTSD